MSDPLSPSDLTVEARNLSRWFGQKVAVSEVTCGFGPGVTGLLGPNGAGKTTLLRMLTGLIRPSDGDVRLLGVDPRSRPGIYRQVALVPEDETVHGFLTARQFVHFNATLQRLADPASAADRALGQVELSEVADRRLATFSKGMRQRAKVAAMPVHEPHVLFLDEPTIGLDVVAQHNIQKFLKHYQEVRKITILLTSHYMKDVAALCKRVVDRKSTRLNSSHTDISRMPSSA